MRQTQARVGEREGGRKGEVCERGERESEGRERELPAVLFFSHTIAV